MEEIRDALEEAICNLYDVAVKVELTAVPDGMEGDYACNVAMRLAKQIGKSPREIAEKIAEVANQLLAGQGKGDDVSRVFVAGVGFLNSTVGSGALLADLDKSTVALADGKYVGKKVIMEFSDPNPFKVLHVGHLYTSVVGDGISRLIECAGGEVHRTNFGGDVGLHVAKTIWEVLRRGDFAEFTKKKLDEKMSYIAECYVVGTRAYEEDEVVKGEIQKLNKEIYEIAEKGQDGTDSEVARFFWMGREASYAYFDEFYARIGLKFEKYYPESTVAGLGLETVKAHVGDVYEESDGAVIYRGEKAGLHTRVFINREGIPTYEAKDVGLIEQKWRDYEFDESIVITAAEQKEYMRVVLQSISEFAPELVKRSRHMTHGMVKLPGAVKMSSRKGNFVTAVDVLEMMNDEVQNEEVALGALKYAFLKVKMDGDIVFDLKESVNMQGNSGPYLQYALVRAKSILRQEASGGGADKLLDEWERRLAKKILGWQGALMGAVEELAPHKICTYLYELAQEFSRFYENDKVVGGDNEALRRKLVEKYAEVLETGLGLLGISALEKM